MTHYVKCTHADCVGGTIVCDNGMRFPCTCKGGVCVVQSPDPRDTELASLRAELAATAEAMERLEGLDAHILATLPYGPDDGSDDESDAWECVDYAAGEIKRLRVEAKKARETAEGLGSALDHRANTIAKHEATIASLERSLFDAARRAERAESARSNGGENV